MTDNFNKQLLLMKKEKFTNIVVKICKERNLPIPEINFDGCPTEEIDELAHYHPDENKICCSERQLHMQNFDDIFDTASHEVAHILELNHDSKLIKEKILNDKAGWMFPAGIIVIDGNQSVSNSEKEESKKYEESLQRINEEIYQNEEQIIMRDYPLAPQPKSEQNNNELTSPEIKKLLKDFNSVRNYKNSTTKHNVNKNQLKQEESKKYVQSEKKEFNSNIKQNTSLIKETKRKGIIESIKYFFGY